MIRNSIRALCLAALLAGAAVAQPQPPPSPQNTAQPPLGTPNGFVIPSAPRPAPAQAPAAPAPGAPGQRPPAGPPTVFGGLSLNNVSLTEVIDLLARQLKINYILDPRVKGGVVLNTYGEIKNIDTRSLLDTILRINGAGMVQQGDIYRIVPLAEVSHLPLAPETKGDAGSIPEDDQTMFNLVFLKYVTADELMKVLQPFVGEGATLATYAPANLLLVLDSRRNMRRLMDLIAMFDSDQLANQRVRVFETKNGRPSDISKELDNIEKSISLSEKNSPIKFLPIDRLNIIIAVAPNPGAFAEVSKWLEKLDIPAKVSAGDITNYVYHVRYGDAQSIGCSIQALYGQLNGYGPQGGGYGGAGGGSIAACMQMSTGFGVGGSFGGLNSLGGITGGLGGNQYGGGYGGNQYGGGYGANQYGGGYGGNQYGGGYGYQGGYGSPLAGGVPGTQNAGVAGGSDLTGQYLGNAPIGGGRARGPRVVANPFNNTLLIQGTAQEYESILKLLKDLDLPPRQVLIEAKIYSVDLTYAFSSGVSAILQKISGTTPHTFLGNLAGDATNLSAATLVGKSRELLAAVQLQENESRAKELSEPSVIATDSIPATINVGTTVPTLSAEAVTGAQSGGTSLFANSVSNTSTGITLNIVARVTPTGIVTMVINQQDSAPTATTSSNIQSPSFSNKSIQTQVTVSDGDTIAIGGAIDETNSYSTSGIPVLNRIPVLGALFGTRSYSKARTELIVFMTPHVIYDSNLLVDASDELKGQMKALKKDIKE
jgi:general secretion pathway protein D